MGNVLIIRNNSNNNRMYEFAKKSYYNNEMGFYNTLDGSLNEKALLEIKEVFGSNGIILFLTYDAEQSKYIKEIFIGTDVIINEKNNISYRMKIHLNREQHERTIESIIDKVDLDINKDFAAGCYVISNTFKAQNDECFSRFGLLFFIKCCSLK